MDELMEKLKHLQKTKYNWEFGGASDERMIWLDNEIRKIENEIKMIKN